MNKTLTLKEIAELTKSILVGDPEYAITQVSDLESAQREDASFLANPRYEQAMYRSKAGVVFVHPNTKLVDARNFLLNENPSLAFQQLVNLLLHDAKELTGFSGIHPTAVIHETAKLGKDVQVGPYAVIDKDVTIGDKTSIGAHCYIGPNTKIGKEALLHPRVTIRERCLLGDRVVIQPGAVIGSCGFGYVPDAKGNHIKLEQLGTVTLEDDVEIGANTTLDRSRFKTTRIKRGSKIDNLVQIAHGVEIGESNLIVGQSGVAGSTKTGKHVVIAGQVAIAGHIELTDQVMIAGKSGVSKSITKSGKYGGIPVQPLDEYNRNAVYLRQIEKYIDKIKELEKKVSMLK